MPLTAKTNAVSGPRVIANASSPKATVKFDNKEDWMVNGDAIMAGLLYEAALSSDKHRVSGQATASGGWKNNRFICLRYDTLLLKISRSIFLLT